MVSEGGLVSRLDLFPELAEGPDQADAGRQQQGGARPSGRGGDTEVQLVLESLATADLDIDR